PRSHMTVSFCLEAFCRKIVLRAVAHPRYATRSSPSDQAANEPNEDGRFGALKMIPPCWARVFKPSAVIKHRYRLTKPEHLRESVSEIRYPIQLRRSVGNYATALRMDRAGDP